MSNIVAVCCRWEAVRAGGFACFIALTLEYWCWGFTVDDAWIVSRVAAHGMDSGSYSFNLGGPPTDAVTPLGFAHFLASLGGLLGISGARELFTLARAIGVVSSILSLGAAAVLASAEQGEKKWWLPGCLVPFALPALLWSGAGLTAPVVGLFVLMGAALVEKGANFAGSACLGAAAAWRPELGPVVLALLFFSQVHSSTIFQRLGGLAWLLVPIILVALVRISKFSFPLPLSFLAKSPDFLSGVRYSLVTLIFGGLPWFVLLLLRRSLFRRWILVWPIHLLALIFAGGDWMPALRLSAPVYPWLLWKLATSMSFRGAGWRGLALVPALYGPLLIMIQQGSDLRAVTARRSTLVADARPALRNSRVVAAVDIGWVGQATEAVIVDLAGVTDPTIAPLPGGHTSKEISPGLFSDRNVDTWVIFASDRAYSLGESLQRVHAAHWVDARLLARNDDLGFEALAVVPLLGSTGQYVIATRVDR